MKRARFKTGSVVFDKHVGTWRLLQLVDGKRTSQTIGTKQQFPTKAAAQKAAQALKSVTQAKITGLMLKALIESYRAEKMPKRIRQPCPASPHRRTRSDHKLCKCLKRW